jgi:hypothetical protein
MVPHDEVAPPGITVGPKSSAAKLGATKPSGIGTSLIYAAVDDANRISLFGMTRLIKTCRG